MKRAGRQVEILLHPAQRLGQHAKTAIGLGARFRCQPLGDLLLKHQRQAREGVDLRQPARQQHRGDVVGQVRHDLARRRPERRQIGRQRIRLDHPQPAGIGRGQFCQRGEAPGVVLDGNHLLCPRRQQRAGEATGAGADLEHRALGQVARRCGNAGDQPGVGEEVLAVALQRRQAVRVDHIAQRRQVRLASGGHGWRRCCAPDAMLR